jgi:RHS repeat-associated protein
VYLQNNQPGVVERSRNDTTESYTDVFIYEGTKRIARVRIDDTGNTKTETFVNNYQGSPVVVLSDAGDIQYQKYLDPFGNMEMEIGVPSSDIEFQYTDKEYDKETARYNFWHRGYDPIGGRFDTRDRVKLEDNLKNYFGINPYVFVNNNPIRNTDPDGRKVNQNGFWLGNPNTVKALDKLNENLVNKGYENNKFTILVTGGDRYKDDFGVIRSSTDFGPIQDSDPNSTHLEDNYGRGVDFYISDVGQSDLTDALTDTPFNGRVINESNYPDAPHIHASIPDTLDNRVIFPSIKPSIIDSQTIIPNVSAK